MKLCRGIVRVLQPRAARAGDGRTGIAAAARLVVSESDTEVPKLSLVLDANVVVDAVPGKPRRLTLDAPSGTNEHGRDVAPVQLGFRFKDEDSTLQLLQVCARQQSSAAAAAATSTSASSVEELFNRSSSVQRVVDGKWVKLCRGMVRVLRQAPAAGGVSKGPKVSLVVTDSKSGVDVISIDLVNGDVVAHAVPNKPLRVALDSLSGSTDHDGCNVSPLQLGFRFKEEGAAQQLLQLCAGSSSNNNNNDNNDDDNDDNDIHRSADPDVATAAAATAAAATTPGQPQEVELFSALSRMGHFSNVFPGDRNSSAWVNDGRGTVTVFQDSGPSSSAGARLQFRSQTTDTVIAAFALRGTQPFVDPKKPSRVLVDGACSISDTGHVELGQRSFRFGSADTAQRLLNVLLLHVGGDAAVANLALAAASANDGGDGGIHDTEQAQLLSAAATPAGVLDDVISDAAWEGGEVDDVFGGVDLSLIHI